MATIKSALAVAFDLFQNSAETPLLDAEILLCNVLDKERAYLRTWPERTLTQDQLQAFQVLVTARQLGKPIAYLTGDREFWSLDFQVSPDVLIPRPETELLVELSLKLIPVAKPCHIIDLGTGSGIIAVSLATERPQAKITATDISSSALEIAKLNATKHKVKSIQFYQSHWFNNVPPGKFNLILSNPPYLAEDDPHLTEGDLRFEPKTALVADQDGLADIKAIAETAITKLESGGYLMVEHGYAQGLTIRNLFIGLGYANVQTYQDLADLPRVTAGQYFAPKTNVDPEMY